MRKREACCGREQFPVRYNKAVRASSLRRRMELRGLCVPARANRRGAWTGPPLYWLLYRENVFRSEGNSEYFATLRQLGEQHYSELFATHAYHTGVMGRDLSLRCIAVV